MKEFLEEIQEKSSIYSLTPATLPIAQLSTSFDATSAELFENEGITVPPPPSPPPTASSSSTSLPFLPSFMCDAAENDTIEGREPFNLTPTAPSEKRPSFGSPRNRNNSRGQGSKGEKRFKVVYCIGSRWSNVIMGAKTSDPKGPALGKKIEGIEDKAEIGWIDEEKIRMHGFPPAEDTMVLVCGLPGVYDKLCGPRNSVSLPKGCVLSNLGYTEEMVLKF